MFDPRIEKHAKLLINYCLEIKPGDRLAIQGSPIAAPLIEAAYREAIIAGAFVKTQIGLPNLSYHLYTLGNNDQLDYVWDTDKTQLEEMDARLYLYGTTHTKAAVSADSTRVSRAQKASGELFKRYMERAASGDLSWVIGLYPTDAIAQEANMSTRAFEDFAYGACYCDTDDPLAKWKEIDKELNERSARISAYTKFRVVSDDTDLTFSTKDRSWIVCSGKNNMPDGELCTAPVEDSANGYIRFNFPAIYNAQPVEDVFLRFKDGVVIEGTAKKGQEVLDKVLAIDEGAKRLGEAAIGTNYAIQRHIKSILFDEKIGGTVHFAIGAAIQEAGGVNESAIHWDLLCDMRTGGEIYGDGELFYKDGHFIE